MKCCRFVAVDLMSLLITLASTEAAGECGRMTIGQAAASLTPCLPATKNPRGKVLPVFCSKVGALIRTNSRCHCAAMLSPLAKRSGISPGIAIGVPKTL
ncbi:PREDICTED: uncharacterized protein LOC109133045 [Camelina sativa]|uniref:Uncharacterized protein LOC109133045 n=1 Tax=Camelina sativa TaxID=90675 RepID=A0ABM1RQ33_CAMSA|nr:PREDICTED: uncharacterized protein LOC109133045 [Camelina sativa]